MEALAIPPSFSDFTLSDYADERSAGQRRVVLQKRQSVLNLTAIAMGAIGVERGAHLLGEGSPAALQPFEPRRVTAGKFRQPVGLLPQYVASFQPEIDDVTHNPSLVLPTRMEQLRRQNLRRLSRRLGCCLIGAGDDNSPHD